MLARPTSAGFWDPDFTLAQVSHAFEYQSLVFGL
jgi:hypothetical protein